jgi:hypothetical protein
MTDNSSIDLKAKIEKKRSFNISNNKPFSPGKKCIKSIKSFSPKKIPPILSKLYSPKREDNTKKNRSSAILHLMDFNNAEEEIKNAIYEMEKSLVLEMEDNRNGLTYLINDNQVKETLINCINHQHMSNFYNKENFKEKVDNRVSNKNIRNTEIKSDFESKIKKRKSSKGIHKIKNRIIMEEKYRVLSHGLFIVDSNDENESDEGGNSWEFYINPETNFVFIYDFIIALCVFYSLIYLPLELANSLCICNPNINYIKFWLNIYIEILFLFDLIINFFLGYYNEKDKLIKKSNTIIKNYI